MLVLNLVNVSISMNCHVISGDMFSTVTSSTYSDPKVWKIILVSKNSRIQVMIYQEDDLYLDGE